ncbi:MAG: 4Fe-4S binding protein [Bacteroidales bacterium]|nr:4Fe-4S binding protein [Bacteroidales bacterium]
MNVHWLKKLRVAVSLLFLILTSLLFLDYRKMIPESWFSTVLSLQFVPSFLKFFTVLKISVFGFIVVIVMTLLFGRIYCSTICPLGILQDVTAYISRKFRSKRKGRYYYRKAKNILRYTILGITAVALVFGSTYLLLLLDPYSNFGRIMTYFVKPLLVWVNNLLSPLLARINVYYLYPVDLKPIKAAVYIVPVIILGLVLWLSVTRGRLYCNTVCPVGAFLGLLSKFSLFKFRFNTQACTGCHLCEFSCKSSCIDVVNRTVDETRCVTCFDCLTSCKLGAMNYTTRKALKTDPVIQPVQIRKSNRKTFNGDHDPGKRVFILGSLAFLAGIAGISKAKEYPKNAKPTTIPEKKNFPVTPPGSLSIRHFTDQCTACSLCIDACPTDVLQPAFLQYGLAGIMQPTMDYHSGYCNYDCVRCTEVCPTGAILPLKKEAKQTVQMGLAHFVKENCVVYTDETNCGACAEHCPTKAVHMIPYKEDLVIPETTDDICIGCGACEHACPTTPFKAIYVDGNEIHKLAKKPKEEKLENPLEKTEDFPF